MRTVRWVYRRLPALTCFIVALGCAEAATETSSGLAAAIASGAFLFASVGFAALTTWREVDDPSL
jgi:hypothetical protein